MGYKTGKEPEAADTFVWRICHALDQKPTDLARNIGVSYKQLEPFLKLPRPAQIGDMDMDEVWFKLEEYVSKQVGMLLATRHELTKALHKTRVQRTNRMERFKAYHGRE